MELNLWVLVDKYKRIYYSGATKEIVENYLNNLTHSLDTPKIIELKGKL